MWMLFEARSRLLRLTPACFFCETKYEGRQEGHPHVLDDCFVSRGFSAEVRIDIVACPNEVGQWFPYLTACARLVIAVEFLTKTLFVSNRLIPPLRIHWASVSSIKLGLERMLFPKSLLWRCSNRRSFTRIVATHLKSLETKSDALLLVVRKGVPCNNYLYFSKILVSS